MDANANYLITGDNDLLELKKMNHTQIIKYTEFEAIIKQ
jgi:predicted nucleic acid-binding protein